MLINKEEVIKILEIMVEENPEYISEKRDAIEEALNRIQSIEENKEQSRYEIAMEVWNECVEDARETSNYIIFNEWLEEKNR